MVDACRENGCALIGGETAEMPGVYTLEDFDLAGTIVGVVDHAKIVNGSRIQAGDVMIGTGGLKKIRFAFQGRGKSGSARVCYVDFATFAKTYLIQVFSKEEKTNLTDTEKNAVKKAIGVLKTEAARNWRKEHE